MRRYLVVYIIEVQCSNVKGRERASSLPSPPSYIVNELDSKLKKLVLKINVSYDQVQNSKK